MAGTDRASQGLGVTPVPPSGPALAPPGSPGAPGPPFWEGNSCDYSQRELLLLEESWQSRNLLPLVGSGARAQQKGVGFLGIGNVPFELWERGQRPWTRSPGLGLCVTAFSSTKLTRLFDGMEFGLSKALSSSPHNTLLPLLSLSLIPSGFISSRVFQLPFNQPHTLRAARTLPGSLSGMNIPQIPLICGTRTAPFHKSTKSQQLQSLFFISRPLPVAALQNSPSNTTGTDVTQMGQM